MRPLEERMDRGFAALAEDISDSRTELVEFKAKTSENFAAIEGQLRDIHQRLTPLETAAENTKGFTKEIDHLFDRLGSVEKHLGIKPKMAA